MTIALQIPQYVILTAGEILFSITGLEFAYSQAAPSMKSVLQAYWLLTVAIGSVVVIVVAEASLKSGNLFLSRICSRTLMGCFVLSHRGGG